MVAPLNIPPRPTRHLMVRLPNWVGDVVMCLPALKHLSSLGMPLIICGRTWAKPLIQNIEKVEFVTLTGVFWHDLRSIRHAVKPNVVGLTFPDSLSSALLFRLAGVPTLGYRDDGRSWLLKWPVVKLTKPMHAVEKWFYLADVGVKVWRDSLVLETSTADAFNGEELLVALPPSIRISLHTTQVSKAQHLLKQAQIADQPYILIAPTATGKHHDQVKIWPYFAALTQALQQQGLTVVACPPQTERAQALQQAPTVQLLEPTDLGTFAALAQGAKLVICNDSGVSHIAAAMGANQITLFGVTDPKHSGPWSDLALCLGQQDEWPNLEQVLQAIKLKLNTSRTHTIS